MSSFEMCFPVKIRSMVPPFLDRLHLLWGPDVQIYGLDTTDMGAHATMNTRAPYAEKDADIPGCPSRIITLAVCTQLVFRLFD